MNVTLGKQLMSQLSNEFASVGSTGALFAPGALSLLGSVSDDINVLSKAWANNPFLYTGSGASLAGVVSIEIMNPNDSSILTVNGTQAPIVIGFTTAGSTDLSDFKCSYWNLDISAWDSSGTALVSLTPGAGGVVNVACATVHLSDFSAVNGIGFMNIQIPNPITEFASLGSVFSLKSLFTTVATLAILGVSLVAWFVSSIVDDKKADMLAQLRKAHVLLYGEVSSGLGMDMLHKGASAESRKKLQALHDKLRVCDGDDDDG